MIETKFYFKDEDGQETELKNTYSPAVAESIPAIELLMVDFRAYLKACTFSDELIVEFAKTHLIEALEDNSSVREELE